MRRTELLRAQLAASAPAADADDAQKAEQLRDEIKTIERRKERLLDELDEHEDAGDPETSREFRRSIRERFDRHERKRRELLTRLQQHEQSRSGTEEPNAGLIDLLPRLGVSLASLPEAEQRRLYDAFQLEVHYLRPRREIRLQVTVPAATAEELGRLARQVVTPLTVARTGEDQPCFGRPRQDSNLRPSA